MSTKKTTKKKTSAAKAKGGVTSTRRSKAKQLIEYDISTPAGRKVIKDELIKCRKVIKTIEAEWTDRNKAMERIGAVIQTDGLLEHAMWPGEMDKIQRCLTTQLSDLRSGVVKVATNLMTTMSEMMGAAFGDTLAHLLPALYKGLYVTIKAISSASENCIMKCLENTFSSKLLAPLLAGMRDAHAIVRARCSHYLILFLGKADEEEGQLQATIGPSNLSKLCDGISTNIEYSDNHVRSSTRALFQAFSEKFPVDAVRLYENFSSQTQKTLTRESGAAKKKKRKSRG